MPRTRKKKNPSPGILDWIRDFLVKPIKDAIAGLPKDTEAVMLRVDVPALGVREGEARDGIEPLVTVKEVPAGPETPRKTRELAERWIKEADKLHKELALVALGVEAASVGQIELAPHVLLYGPTVNAFLKYVTELYKAEWEATHLIPLKQFWLGVTTPIIPPVQDLRLMAVREAFPVEPGPPQYKEMEKWGKLQGLSPWWVQRYLYMGFERMDVRDAEKYFMYWRHDPEGYKAFLRIADIHPDDRPRVAEVAFKPPGVREIGYGWDVGAYEEEDIEVFRRKAGQSPADAKKSAFAMVKYRLAAEEEALRREALADFVAGLDTEEALRAKLASFRSRPEVIELWVARAKYRRHRDLIKDLIKVAVTDFVKGWSTENELRQDLVELKVVAANREVIIEEAKARRMKYKREEKVAKKKTITVARVRKARELGLIGDMEYVRRLEDHDYTPEDARLDLEIELTPFPITPEEIERRMLTVTSKYKRARRRFDRTLKRLEDQIELTALQLEDTTIMKDEALDVIDAQIALLDEDVKDLLRDKEDLAAWRDEEMAKAREELEAEELEAQLGKIKLEYAKKDAKLDDKIKKREGRITVLVQRRELTEARWTARIRKLTEQQSDLKETKELVVGQFNEEIAEYEREIELLGAKAG